MSSSTRVALITGANKGIGFETARQLGAQGIHILVGARDHARGEAAAGQLRSADVDSSFIPIDVTDQATIDAAVATIAERYGRLDILVNNAGLSLPEARVPSSELSLAALQATYATNVYGVLAVTQAMLPLLLRAEAGRIVNVSSSMGSLTLNSDPALPYAQLPPLLAYCSSKTAVNAITVFLARELRDTPIKINSADPGYVATDLNNHSGWRTPQQAAQVVVQLASLGSDGPSGGFFDENGVVPW
jgi:NAD(P)-dependent dehydrogenase (short-subunit alcohol dehydrogenase family)